MPTPTPRSRPTAAPRRHPTTVLASVVLACATPLALLPAHAQEREPVYSPDRGGLAPAAPAPGNVQEAEWPARVGRIAQVLGDPSGARMLDRDDNDWIAATINRPVTGGDQFATQPGTRLEISIGSSTLRLDGDSELVLQRLDDEAVVLHLRRGSLALQAVSAEMAAQIDVHTREGRFRPREPGSYRIDRRDDTSHATAWRGSLRFEGSDSLLVIARGQHAEVWLEGRTTHYRWAEEGRDDFAAWVARDEQAYARSESARYLSPEMTGWQDLDRNGRWEIHPEYGAIWAPTVVPVGWAPYRSGHWAWIAPWGWTWIDDASWGFAPFHYGRWVHYRQRWCWVPGHRAVRPVYSPALVAWIGGGRVSVGIGGAVGWVPLGPRDVYVRHRGPDRGHDRDRDGWRDGGRDTPERRPVPGAPRVPNAPMMFSNQAVPGAVTTIAPDAFAGRRVVPVVNATGGAALRGAVTRTPVTPMAPPPAPPRVANRDPAEGEGRRVVTPPFAREPAPEAGRTPTPAAPFIERTPAPERAATPRVVQPVPRAPDGDAEHERGRGRSRGEGSNPNPAFRGGDVRVESGRSISAPVGAPAAPAAPPSPPPAAPAPVAPPQPAPVPAAPRVAPPLSAPAPAVAPPRTPADAPRGLPPARERERERDEDRSGRQRGPEPRENLRERGQSR